MAAGADADEEPSSWFADSGASHHMTDQWHWFFNFVDNLAGTWLVHVVSGQTSWDLERETSKLRLS
jgi:hypothetical protein